MKSLANGVPVTEKTTKVLGSVCQEPGSKTKHENKGSPGIPIYRGIWSSVGEWGLYQYIFSIVSEAARGN